MRHGIVLFTSDRGVTPAQAAKAAEEQVNTSLSVQPLPSAPTFPGIPNLPQSPPKDFPTLTPTFLLPQSLPSDLLFATTVTVRPGDTLSLIACQHSTTVAELETLNHLGSSTTIKAGQRLTVPTCTRPPPRAANAERTVRWSSRWGN